MPKARVIDLSHHNIIPNDLLATRDAGIVAVVHKLTEGSNYIDDKVQARWYLTMEAGMAWGVYHFMRPGSMNQQAEFFVRTAEQLGVMDEDTMFAADHEDQNVSGEQLKEFLDRVEELTGRSPVIYSGHVIKDQLKGTGYTPTRRLWLAQYTSTPTLPEGVEKYWMWQYTDKGTIPGVNPPTDLNTFEGDDRDFLNGWAGYFDAPEPAPEYAEVYMTIDAPPNVKITVNGVLIT